LQAERALLHANFLLYSYLGSSYLCEELAGI
jgi:hypothetical protein